MQKVISTYSQKCVAAQIICLPPGRYLLRFFSNKILKLSRHHYSKTKTKAQFFSVHGTSLKYRSLCIINGW